MLVVGNDGTEWGGTATVPPLGTAYISGVQDTHRCSTLGDDWWAVLVVGGWLGWVCLEVFPKLNDSMRLAPMQERWPRGLRVWCLICLSQSHLRVFHNSWDSLKLIGQGCELLGGKIADECC